VVAADILPAAIAEEAAAPVAVQAGHAAAAAAAVAVIAIRAAAAGQAVTAIPDALQVAQGAHGSFEESQSTNPPHELHSRGGLLFFHTPSVSQAINALLACATDSNVLLKTEN